MYIASLVRKFTFLFVLSALSFAVINCSKKDDGDTGSTAQIVGNWKITGVYTKAGNDPEVDQYPIIVGALSCFPNIVMTFNPNGLIAASVPSGCEAAVNSFVGDINGSAYEVKGGQLIIIDGNNNPIIMTVNFSGNQMAWIDSSTSGGTTVTNRIVFTKQ